MGFIHAHLGGCSSGSFGGDDSLTDRLLCNASGPVAALLHGIGAAKYGSGISN